MLLRPASRGSAYEGGGYKPGGYFSNIAWTLRRVVIRMDGLAIRV